MIEKKQKYQPGNANQEETTKRLLEWIADAVQPFSVVENARFLALLESLNYKYNCPSEKVIRTTLFPAVFSKVKDRVNSILSSHLGDSVSLTTDMWTSKTHNCYIGLTMQYLDEKFRPKMMVLGCFPFSESHDAASTAVKMCTLSCCENNFGPIEIIWPGVPARPGPVEKYPARSFPAECPRRPLKAPEDLWRPLMAHRGP